MLIAAAAAFCTPADAIQFTRAYKTVNMTVIVTPSPTPVAAVQPPAFVRHAQAVAALASNPYGRGIMRIANSTASTYDVAPGAPFQIAQVQGNTPVQFVAKVDPTAAYLHIIPGSGGLVLNAGYGPNTFTCVYQVYAFYPNTWKLTDWGAGTVQNAAGTFPIMNYPTASYMSWLAEGVTTTYKAFANSGTPGENTFLGTAGVSQQVCFDISLNVPASQPPGTYAAAVQYTLISN